MKATTTILSLLAVSAVMTPASAQDLASASPFRIDIQTNDGGNYEFSDLNGASPVSFSLNYNLGSHYFLGVNTSTQFAAEITGLEPGEYSMVYGAASNDFGLVSFEFFQDSIWEVYLGNFQGLEPIFSSGTAYSLANGQTLISALPTSFYDFDLVGGNVTRPIGFAVAQYEAGTQPVTFFVWDAEQNQATAATTMSVPSVTFGEHQLNSYFFPTFQDLSSGSGGYRFWSDLSSGTSKTFVAFLDEDLDVTAAYTLEPALGSTISWQFLGFATPSGYNIFTGFDFNLETFSFLDGYVSMMDDSGTIRWTRRYSRPGGDFSTVFYAGEVNGEVFLHATFTVGGDTVQYLIGVDANTGAVLRAFDTTAAGAEVFLLGQWIDQSNDILYADSSGEEQFLYAITDSNFQNGALHRLSVDVPANASVSGWFYNGNPDVPEAQISLYDGDSSLFQTWFSTKNSCDIFETISFSLTPVTVNSVIAASPQVTSVSVNTSTPNVSLNAQSLSLPTVTEEPSTRVVECFGGGNGGGGPNDQPWYEGASNIQPAGWRYFDWFKGFKPEGPNWIYHGRHGWLYVLADDTSSMFLWDVALGRWMYTNETIYPWMYAYGPNEGWVFFFEGGRPGSRYFKRGDNGQVVSEQQLSANP